MSSSSATAATVYTVDLPPTGDLTLTGTITTDGNLGALTLSNFLDWDLTVSSTSLSASYEFFGPAHGPTSNSTYTWRRTTLSQPTQPYSSRIRACLT